MNKYAEALNYIWDEYEEGEITSPFMTRHCLETLRELIEKNMILEAAFGLACEELVDSSQYDTGAKVYFRNGGCKYACEMTKEQWEEYLISEVKA